MYDPSPASPASPRDGSTSPRDGSTSPRDGTARRLAAALALAYFLLHAPSLFDYSRWNGDDRYYVDAALGMRDAGDWSTAVYPDGRPRFAKPLLAYWLIGASHAAFGVGLASSRAPFLAAGALLVFLTFCSGRRLLGDDVAALGAAAIVFASPQLAALSTRLTPDILVCLFSGLCLHGLARALARGRATAGDAFCVWVGAGLMVAAKGGLGIVAPLFVLAFAAAWRAPGLRARDLVRWPGLLLGLAIAATGVGTPVLRHGRSALAGLASDQVGGQYERGVRPFLVHAVVNVRAVAKNLLPWSAFALAGWAVLAATHAPAPPWRRRTAALALAWLVTLVAIFASATTMRGRYLAPAHPLLAVLFAGLIVGGLRAGGAGHGPRALRGFLLVPIAASALAGVGLVALGARFEVRLALAGAALLCAAVVVTVGMRRAMRRGGDAAPLFASALVVGVALCVVDIGVRPLFDATPVEAAAARLGALGFSGREVATLGGEDSLPSQLRLASGGRLAPVSLRSKEKQPADVLEAGRPFRVVVVAAEAEAKLFAAAGWRVERVGFAYDRWKSRELRRALLSANPAERIEAKKLWTYLVVRPDAG